MRLLEKLNQGLLLLTHLWNMWQEKKRQQKSLDTIIFRKEK